MKSKERTICKLKLEFTKQDISSIQLKNTRKSDRNKCKCAVWKKVEC
jgi:hypothetical protein